RLQIPERRINGEKRPAGEARVYRALKPAHCFRRITQQAVNAGDLMIGVVRVAKRSRHGAGLAYAVEGPTTFTAISRDESLQANEDWVFLVPFEHLLHQSRRGINVASQQSRPWAIIYRIDVSGALLEPGFNFPPGFPQISFPEIRLDHAMGAGILRIEAVSALIKHARFGKAANVGTDGAKAIVGV